MIKKHSDNSLRAANQSEIEITHLFQPDEVP